MGALKSIVYLIIVVLLSGVILRIFVFDTFLVQGTSMAPTILPGDYIFVNKLSYHFGHTPERGDVVVTQFRSETPIAIKRIIGLPRERIEISKGRAWLVENGRTIGATTTRTRINNIEQHAAFEDTPITFKAGTTTLQLDPEEYFVLGDNRFGSTDSRELGPVDLWDIYGEVFFWFRPLSLKGGAI